MCAIVKGHREIVGQYNEVVNVGAINYDARSKSILKHRRCNFLENEGLAYFFASF